MVFSSVTFLFIFLPAVLAVYYIVPKGFRSIRNTVLLLFSLAFYAYGEPKYVLIMLLSILLNYGFGLGLGRERSGKIRRFCVIAAICCNLAILFYFKYTGFFVTNLNNLFGLSLRFSVIMPIGISFFTFQGMSYVIDAYRLAVPVQKNPLYVALYISLFPQLIAGPIVRYETVAGQLEDRAETLNGFSSGISRFITGLGKKILLANTLGYVADLAFTTNISLLTTGFAWLGVLCYAFQIYFDFSGYSDMAIGLGRMFGFEFLENFNYPYISKSITEFWRRWHISLSTWFRDYLYIPLGGNRTSKPRWMLNLIIVWLLTGFWHGAAWNFVLWGLYYAVILLIEKLFLHKLLDKAPGFFGHVYTMFLIMIGWVIFRADSLTHIRSLLCVLFGFSGAEPTGQALLFLSDYKIELILAAAASAPLIPVLRKRLETAPDRTRGVFEAVRLASLAVIFILSIAYLVKSTYNPFIYFRF